MVLEERDGHPVLTDAAYRLLLHQQPVGAYLGLADASGSTLSINRDLQQMLGYSEQEWLEKPDFGLRIVHRDDRSRLITERLRQLTSLEPLALQYRVAAKDGRVVWLRDHRTIVRDPPTNVLRVHGVVIDITEQKEGEIALRKVEELTQANEDLERAARAKSKFLADLSHELRTPLNAILGFSEVLQDGIFGELNQSQQDSVGNVMRAGRHLLELVNAFLDISKIDAGRMDLRHEDVDLNAMLTEVRATMLPVAEQRQVDLQLTLPEAHPVILADQARLVQIVYNLLSNAIKFTPVGGTVRMSAHIAPETVAVAVADTGIGIAPEDQARIFEEFEQIDSPSTRRERGTGLGLALTRRLVELHGGKIGVQSVVGQGSTFTVVLPRPSRDAITSGALGTVLVVEDDPAARALLRIYLTAGGYGMQWVEHVSEVVPRVRELQPVAITLDLIMKDELAWSALEELKADPATRDIPVVIVSILNEQQTGFALGTNAYLTKPVARQTLLSTLRHVMESSGRTQDTGLRVLALDDEPEALDLLAMALDGTPHRLVKVTSGVDALELLAQEQPDVLITDLMMAPLSGFEVIDAVLSDPQLRRIPIIVVTARDLTLEDMARLNKNVLTTLSKQGFNQEQFLRELQRSTHAQGSQ
jgi:PAS domain S-box-containing protein